VAIVRARTRMHPRPCGQSIARGRSRPGRRKESRMYIGIGTLIIIIILLIILL
jgi:hypothetical protein